MYITHIPIAYNPLHSLDIWAWTGCEYNHTNKLRSVRAETDDKFNSVAHEKHISAMCVLCCIIYIVYGDRGQSKCTAEKILSHTRHGHKEIPWPRS